MALGIERHRAANGAGSLAGFLVAAPLFVLLFTHIPDHYYAQSAWWLAVLFGVPLGLGSFVGYVIKERALRS